ncbi:Zinc finger MYM-type protein 1 [Frankliniella fusca]|uniref:Zinc finger MYM-type protein 1 n=1 Tax=Frankliniella fusca TaxID=407009 RepID=A0AAE1HNQ2_9NEOP|nr:Zinc finger MYM-type protein 1 [Frankliniella fusca]
MPAWGKYLKHYNAKWEKEKIFEHAKILASSENAKIWRSQRTPIFWRLKTPTSLQCWLLVIILDWLAPSTEEDVMKGKPEAYCKIKDEAKEADLKLAVFIHCAVQSIDHLGEILTVLGKGSPLEKLRLHRTKCSKLISNVVAPAFLTEIKNDIGDSPYSLIVDESTDVSTTKFMALCVRYHSKIHKKMVTDFLGIIQVHSCTGVDLAKAVVEYLQVIGLILGNLHATGTDGAANMCGANNSFYTHLRSMVPGGRLQLLKCVCHSLDKCAEYAFKTVPNHLTFLLTETFFWDKRYLTFIKSVLGEVHAVSLAFEHTNADVTKLYTDMRGLVYGLAGRVLKHEAIAETTRPSVLRQDEFAMFKAAFANAANLRSTDNIKFGDNFTELVKHLTIPADALNHVQAKCGNYLLTLCRQLLDRMPSNLDSITKLKFFTPRLVLARVGRPEFHQLPLDILDPSVDREALENQWEKLGTLPLHEICPHADMNEDIDAMHIEHFWSCVLECSTAVGAKPFKELAQFALKALTIPISNAVVERIFSFMSHIKNKRRNKMQLLMLQALLRLRTFGKCCKTFEPTKDMFKSFNSSMYSKFHSLSSTFEPTLENPNEDPDDVAIVLDEVEMSENDDIEDEDYTQLLSIFDNGGFNGECVTLHAL